MCKAENAESSFHPAAKLVKPSKIREIKPVAHSRFILRGNELNRVLGGGVVPGSLVLIGGEPGIGKSMTFKLIGIAADGRRILQFSHDHTRRHSPVIHHMADMYIIENKSLRHYLQQLQKMGERPAEYAGLWDYAEGDTETRFSFFEYPEQNFRVTEQLSNYSPLP